MDSIRDRRLDAGRWGVLIEVPDPEAAAEWLAANLFFTLADTGGAGPADSDEPVEPVKPIGSAVQPACRMLVNGSCALYLRPGASAALAAPAAGHYCTGLAHVALRTDHIDEAIRWWQSRSLVLQLDAGASFHNPKVFGNGEQFFNIISPFGVIFEVSQRIGHPSPFQEPVICGLDHLGIPSPDIGAELGFFEGRGFRPLFATVENWNAAEGTFRCCMLGQADPRGHEITLEVYQFLDMEPVAMPADYGIRGLVQDGEAIGLPGATARSPGKTVNSPAGVRVLALDY